MRRAAFAFACCLAFLGAGSSRAPTASSSSLPSLTRKMIELSEDSAVHLLYRPKGESGLWYGLCTASKISPTELISAEHCFSEAMSNTLPANAFAASNYIGISSYDYAVADPEQIGRPILRVTGLSLGRLSDLALLTVKPHLAPATAADERKWSRVATIALPLANQPPQPSTLAVVTSYPFEKDLHFHKVTYFGTFVQRSHGKPDNAAQDSIALKAAPNGACKPGASGSRLIFANGTASGALFTALDGICNFSVLTDQVLQGLRAGLRHRAIRTPTLPPQPQPAPDPSLSSASFDGLAFRFHFGGHPAALTQAEGTCPVGSVNVGGVGGSFEISNITASTGGWNPVEDSSVYYGTAYLENGAVIGIGIVLKIESATDGTGVISFNVGCPSTGPSMLPASGEFDNSGADSTVSGSFTICASYSFTHPDPYDLYVSIKVHDCPVVTPTLQ